MRFKTTPTWGTPPLLRTEIAMQHEDGNQPAMLADQIIRQCFSQSVSDQIRSTKSNLSHLRLEISEAIQGPDKWAFRVL